MEYRKVSAEEAKLTNYPAYAVHFQPLDFYLSRSNRQTYIYAFPAGQEDAESYIQYGTPEYINGWLYGGVQVACGQCQSLTPPQTGKLLTIAMEARLSDDSPASRVFLYTGDAGTAADVRAELNTVVRNNLDETARERVYSWEDFFYWYGKELNAAGFIELRAQDSNIPHLCITGVIPLRLACDESILDMIECEGEDG